MVCAKNCAFIFVRVSLLVFAVTCMVANSYADQNLLAEKPVLSEFLPGYIITDIDGTLFDDGENGTFQGRFVLTLVEHRTSSVEPSRVGYPTKIILTNKQVIKYGHLFSNGQGIRTDFTTELDVKTLDGQAVKVPIGMYGREHDYFQLFGPGENGRNYFLEDVLAALESSKKDSSLVWQGRSWKYIQAALSHPETAKRVYFLTKRYHTKEEFLAVMRELKKRGLIKFLPDPEQFVSVTAQGAEWMSASGQAYHNSMDVFKKFTDQRKIEWLRMKLRELTTRGIQPTRKILNADGQFSHAIPLVFFENSRSIIDATRELFENFSGRTAPGLSREVKLMLYDADEDERRLGLSEDYYTVAARTRRETDEPRAMVFMSNTRVREAAGWELVGIDPLASDLSTELTSMTTGFSQCELQFWGGVL